MKTKLLQALDKTPRPIIKQFKVWTGTKHRTVAEPNEPLKTQLSIENDYLLVRYERLLKEHSVADIPQAYRKAHGVHTNAVKHKKNDKWYRFDFKNFYDTIHFEDFEMYLRSHYKDIRKRPDAYKACFIDPNTDGLTQGSPTSGTLAGMALIPFWVELKKRLPDATITQYSDDLCISGINDMSLKELQKIIIRCIKKVGLKVRINTLKTRMDKDQYRCLTGVACNHQNKVTCYRKNYRKFRALLHNMKQSSVHEGLVHNNMTALQCMGQLNYMNHIDETGKIRRLIKQYQKQINILQQKCIEEQHEWLQTNNNVILKKCYKTGKT